MMRVLIDEDTAVQLHEPLQHVLIRHEVDHITTRGWSGKKIPTSWRTLNERAMT